MVLYKCDCNYTTKHVCHFKRHLNSCKPNDHKNIDKFMIEKRKKEAEENAVMAKA